MPIHLRRQPSVADCQLSKSFIPNPLKNIILSSVLQLSPIYAKFPPTTPPLPSKPFPAPLAKSFPSFSQNRHECHPPLLQEKIIKMKMKRDHGSNTHLWFHKNQIDEQDHKIMLHVFIRKPPTARALRQSYIPSSSSPTRTTTSTYFPTS